MGFHNPRMSWSDLEGTLSGRGKGKGKSGGKDKGKGKKDDERHLHPVVDPLAVDGDGGDSPAWSRKRQHYQAPALVRTGATGPYAELHCHTTFSFLDGASHPEEPAEEAARLGLNALAVTDHDGFYGVVRFSQAARELELGTIFGAELSLDLSKPQNGEPDPEGRHLLALAHGPEGYARLARTISRGQLNGEEKGKPDYGDLEQIAEVLRDHVLILTGCRKGSVPRALATGGIDAAAYELDRLVTLFGRSNVAVELTSHGDPYDDDRNDALHEIAKSRKLPVVATNNVHYA